MNFCSAVRETTSLSFDHYLGCDFSISCSKDLGIKAERSVACAVRWCFIYGLCQALQMGFIEVYNFG